MDCKCLKSGDYKALEYFFLLKLLKLASCTTLHLYLNYYLDRYLIAIVWLFTRSCEIYKRITAWINIIYIVLGKHLNIFLQWFIFDLFQVAESVNMPLQGEEAKGVDSRTEDLIGNYTMHQKFKVKWCTETKAPKRRHFFCILF